MREAALPKFPEVGAVVRIAPARRQEVRLAEEPPARQDRDVKAALRPDVPDEVEPPLSEEGDLAADEVETADPDRDRGVDDPPKRLRVRLGLRLETPVSTVAAVEVAESRVLEGDAAQMLERALRIAGARGLSRGRRRPAPARESRRPEGPPAPHRRPRRSSGAHRHEREGGRGRGDPGRSPRPSGRGAARSGDRSG